MVINLSSIKQYPPIKVATYVLALILPIYFWGPLIKADWATIDDHEIMMFIGTAQNLALKSIPSAIVQTELNTNSQLPRFRPSYFGLRIFESVAWGKDAQLWYLIRISIGVLLSITIANICLTFTNGYIASGFLIWALSQPYWISIIGRAGPGETYCVLGSCLAILGLLSLHNSEYRLKKALFFTLIGIVIAAGSKENFLVMGLIPIWILYKLKWNKENAKQIFGCLLTISFLVWIFSVVLSRIYSAGTDVYANDASFLARINIATQIIYSKTVQCWLITIVLMSFMLMSINLNLIPFTKLRKVSRVLLNYTYYISFLFCIYAMQYVFYFGLWPDRVTPRYLFPGILAFQGAVLIGLLFINLLIKTLVGNQRINLFISIAILLGFVGTSWPYFNENRSQSIQAVVTTREHMTQIKKIANFLKTHHNYALIINSHQVRNDEAIISLSRFVRSEGVENLIALKINNYHIEDFEPNTLNAQLAQMFYRISNNGLPGFFSSLNSVKGFPCISVGFSGPALESCEVKIEMPNG